MMVWKLGVVLAVLVCLLCGCQGPAIQRFGPELTAEGQAKSQPVTGILGAFEQEIVILEDKLTEPRGQKIEGIRFVTGKLSGRRVVVGWTGIGTVNAAVATALMVEHFKPGEIIFTGVAGAVNPQLLPGDIVVAEKIAYHDMGVLTTEGLLYKGVKNRLDGIENPVFFPADEQLLKLAEKAAGQVKLGILRTSEGDRSPKIVKGVIVTGDTFIASKDKCAELRAKLGADAVEMEGAAVAQVCYQREIPFVVIRCISDKADASAKEDLATFYVMSAENSANLVAEMVGLFEDTKIKNKK